MKILIDNSNLAAGGGIQVAVSFLEDLNILQVPNEYLVIQSPGVSKQTDTSKFSSNFLFENLSESVHSCVLKRVRAVKRLEKKFKPDCIFTTFGPSYHKSTAPKVVGFAIPYIIYPESPFLKRLDPVARCRFKLLDQFKSYHFHKNSDALIFESEVAREKFDRKINSGVPTYTVGNTLNGIFHKESSWVEIGVDKVEFNILSLSANYPHKNLTIIPEVIDELLKLEPKFDFRFHISLNKEDLNFSDFYNQYINYIGYVRIEQLPSLYRQMNVLFFPTLLEVFSTTYLEAMFMEVPIVTSDLSFAHDVCGDGAIFCTPDSAADYANALYKLHTEKNLNQELVCKAKMNFKRFINSRERTLQYLEIIRRTAESIK